MNLQGRNRVRHIHNRDSLSPDLIEFIERVLEAAAGDLQSNIFLFPDVDSEVNLAPERGKIYGMIRRILCNDPSFAPVDDAALSASYARGYSPAVIWISSLALSAYVPEIFRTGVLAHELSHARQIDHAEEIGDVLDAWDCYEHFLIEKQQPLLSYWKRPHEIDAELSARKVIRQLHPGESLDLLLPYYTEYEPVLQFESSGGFDLLEYFGEVIQGGPSGFRQWLSTRDRTCQENVILARLAPE